jgi:hypothetical protein
MIVKGTTMRGSGIFDALSAEGELVAAFLKESRKGGGYYIDFRRVVDKLKTDYNMTETEAVAELHKIKGIQRHPYLIWLDHKAHGGQGGKHYDDFRRVVEKLKTDLGISENQTIARLEAVKGELRHPYLVGLDGKACAGEGGNHYDDFRRVVDKTDLGISENQAIARLESVKGELRHLYLVGLDGKRLGKPRGNTGNHATVQTSKTGHHAAVQGRVRESSASLIAFELKSIFFPAKDTNIDSLTYIMSLRDLRPLRTAARALHAEEESSGRLDDFKLRTWTVSCLLSDLWYVNANTMDTKKKNSGCTSRKIVAVLSAQGIKISITTDIWYSYSYVCAYFLQYTFWDTLRQGAEEVDVIYKTGCRGGGCHMT